MLLAVDIGNTSIKFGLFDGDQLLSKFSIPTNREASTGDIQNAVGDRLSLSIETVIICSVVPELTRAIYSLPLEDLSAEPVVVDNSFDFGLKVTYEPLESLGTDRLVGAFAAVEKYGAPCVVCSLGTATTIDVVNAEREFVGGIIAPGIDAMAEALHLKAPRLPKVEIARPDSILGTSTAGSIRSGLYNGYVAMVEGLITRVRSQSGVVKVVATGGNASRLSDEFEGLISVEEDLVLKGLMSLGSKLDARPQ
jgi:type III pantothenate kinase